MNSQYSAFITAAKLKSISKTAEHLGYTQSGVSKQLKTLEKEWARRHCAPKKRPLPSPTCS